MSAPTPSPTWSAETKRWWRDFWASEQGQRLPVSMHPTVWRLFGWYHRRTLLERRVDKLFETPRGRAADRLFIKGSTGQDKVNPLIAELRAIEEQIEALERRVYGTRPEGPASDGRHDPAELLAAINARVAEAITAQDRDDPRLELVEGGAA